MDLARRRLLDITLNLVVLILEGVALFGSWTFHEGIKAFAYYTQWANAAGLVSCALTLVEYAFLRDGRLDRVVTLVRYAASAMLVMTALVVVFVLVPAAYAAGLDGIKEMFFTSTRIVTHVLGPILVVCGYAYAWTGPAAMGRDRYVGFVCTCAYAVFAYGLNVAGILDGPYPFLRARILPVWQSVLWFVILVLISLLACRMPGWLRSRGRKDPAS